MSVLIEVIEEPTYVKAESDHVTFYREIGNVVIIATIAMNGKEHITVERRLDK